MTRNAILRSLTVMVLILGLLILPACSPQETTETPPAVQMRIAALKGPTGMGLVKLMSDHEAGKTANDYSFSITGTPDDIVAMVSSGQVDIAALPTNMAAVLYQKTSKNIQLLAINTLGVLYILEKGDTVNSLEDLRGRELFATGQGATPEYAINELLDKAGLLDDVTVTYKTEHEELATLAAAGQADLLLLPEPFVTTVLSKNTDLRIALDLTKVWQDAHQGDSQSELAMGCMIVNKAFAAEYPQAVATFLDEYKTSVDTINQDPVTAAEWVVQYEIMGSAALAEKAIPNCHIVLIQGQEMQPVLDPFYQVLFAANPKSIGGSMPDAEFYYVP